MGLARYLSKLAALVGSDGKVPAGGLATGAAVSNIGYTPVNKAGDTISGTSATMLTVQNTSTYARFALDGATGTGGDLIFKSNGVSKYGVYNLNGGGDLGFYPNDTSTAAMMLTSAGYVLKPQNPAFYADSNGTDPIPAGTVTWQNVRVNVGGNFATTGTYANQRFTAPITGTYVFFWQMQHNMNYNSDSAILDLYKNGSIWGKARLETPASLGWLVTHGTAVVSLAANEYVEVFAGAKPHSNYTSFSGFLLG